MGAVHTGDAATTLCSSQDFHARYSLGVKIGLGAFAQVRVATVSVPKIHELGGDDMSSGRPTELAVKIVTLMGQETPVDAAVNEAVVWNAVGSHPNCVRLKEVFFDSRFCYLVMEKCGSSLHRALEDMPELTERGLGRTFGQMLCGIRHCHGRGILHRDIKPDNWMVGGDDGQVKLCDFGLAVAMPKRGKVQGVCGTPPFMCPEMLAGRSYDDKADVWSFGVIVYVFLFGQFPYMPEERCSKGMKAAITEGTSPPKFVAPSCPSGLESSSMRSEAAVSFSRSLLQRDPERRPNAAECLRTAWMTASARSYHLADATLPSLRPMLDAAKEAGALKVRGVVRDSSCDVLLNEQQLQKHGRPLPEMPSARQSSKPHKEQSPSASKCKDQARPSNCSNNLENLSDISTRAGSEEKGSQLDVHKERRIARASSRRWLKCFSLGSSTT